MAVPRAAAREPAPSSPTEDAIGGLPVWVLLLFSEKHGLALDDRRRSDRGVRLIGLPDYCGARSPSAGQSFPVSSSTSRTEASMSEQLMPFCSHSAPTLSHALGLPR